VSPSGDRVRCTRWTTSICVRGSFQDREALLPRSKTCLLYFIGIQQAAPLYFYGVSRRSALYQWPGELRQLLLFGTTLGDEKVVGQTLDNMDKKLSILTKYFGSGVNSSDFEAFMRAKTAPDIEAVVQKMLNQKIKRISISKEPVRIGFPMPTDLIDVKRLEEG
jgi:hypothetical protein